MVAMEGRIEQLEGEKKDRELRSFRLEMMVNPMYHPKIIGRRGAVISKIRDAHQVWLLRKSKMFTVFYLLINTDVSWTSHGDN